jgi:hypothetical protein
MIELFAFSFAILSVVVEKKKKKKSKKKKKKNAHFLQVNNGRKQKVG